MVGVENYNHILFSMVKDHGHTYKFHLDHYFVS